MTRILFLLAASLLPLVAGDTPRQAATGRLWLRFAENQTPARDIRVSTGSATPAPWEKDPALRERSIDVLFPIRWWDWTTLTLRFTPEEDGTVDLVLLGPWEQEAPGTSFREEVLWDNISAEGTHVHNGDFEIATNGAPEGWTPIYQNFTRADEWPLKGAVPLEGKALASTSQDRPLAQPLVVKAGREVTLRFHAKAATLPGFTPPRILTNDTPAHRAAADLHRGVNLGNCWDAPPPYTWGIRYSAEDIDRIAAEGFDHIRVPVAWSYHLQLDGEEWKIDTELLADLEPVLRRALEKGLHVLLDWHHFDDLTTDPATHRARFISSWKSIARHFKSWPPGLFLELLNEPRDALTTEIANPIYADTIAAIRQIDPQRIILVSPGNWGDIRELEKLRLPDQDDRIIVTVHCYEPFHFTHQGANWVGMEKLRGVTYPGPPSTPLAVPESLRENVGVRDFIAGYNELPEASNPSSKKGIRVLLDLARAWSDHFSRPVHLGEFGSHRVADPASRSRYSHDVRMLAEERGIPWALWDWKAGFAYWDPETNKPLLREALFD